MEMPKDHKFLTEELNKLRSTFYASIEDLKTRYDTNIEPIRFEGSTIIFSILYSGNQSIPKMTDNQPYSSCNIAEGSHTSLHH